MCKINLLIASRTVALLTSIALCTTPQAQELRTLSNGTVANADDLNYNFTQLNNAVGTVASSSPFDPARHVILNDRVVATSPCSDDRGFTRVNLDGTISSAEFVVPQGHTLFITDVSWDTIDDPTSFVVGRTLSLTLFASDPDGANSLRVYASPKIDLTSNNASGRPGGSDSLSSGFAVGEGRIICPSVWNRSQTSGSRNRINNAVLLGFLVPN